MSDFEKFSEKILVILAYLKELFVGKGDFKKYTLRFGLILLISLPIIYFTQGAQLVKTILYKICLLMIMVGLAELFWAVGYKPVFGKIEVLHANKRQAVLIFRGLLYAAIILGGTLGL
jgi:hypothetical protein